MMRLSELDLSQRLAITGFLVACVLGFAAAGLLYSSAGDEVAISGILSPERARLKHSASPLERAVKTAMREHVASEADVTTIGDWIQSGCERREYYETVHGIIKRDCSRCHAASAAVAGAMPLSTHAEVLPYAATRGAPIHKLFLRAHVHLLGLGTVLLILCLLVGGTRLPLKCRATLCATLFALFIADVVGQYLAKLHDSFSYVVWAAGLLLGAFVLVAVSVAMYELWFGERPS